MCLHVKKKFSFLSAVWCVCYVLLVTAGGQIKKKVDDANDDKDKQHVRVCECVCVSCIFN